MPKKNTPITFLIPTYAGRELLRQNLPSVLAEMAVGDELFVSEDAVDVLENLRYFRQKYDVQLVTSDRHGQLYRARITHQGKAVTVSFYQRRVNGRFARNVNEAVALIDHNYFFLLNNDVKLTPGCRDQLLSLMQKDADVFAVTAKEIDPKNAGQAAGRNRLWWERGRFWHSRDENLDTGGPTAWACGGSSLYDKDKWEILGGFDTRYYPAYWEDIDLSVAATRRGWRVLYCAGAVVHHIHETTNRDVFGTEKIAAMSWRGGTKFAWKNARGRQKLSFCWYYWYWQFKQFPELKLWALVLALALGMRLAFLDIPHGLTVDEAAIAYNGHAVVTAHRDEWLNFLPVSFRSFGDFKAPLAMYISGLVTVVGGLEVATIRLPFALTGVAVIVIMMKLVDLLTHERTPRHLTYAAIAGLLLTLSPWHFHFSHLGFESNLALCFQLLAVYLLIKNLRSPTDGRGRVWAEKWWSGEWLAIAVSLVLSLYSYHSAKITVPLLLLASVIVAGRAIWVRRRVLVIPLVVAVVMVTPLLQDSLCSVDQERPFTFLAWSQSVAGKPTWTGGVCGDGRLTGQGNGLVRAGSSFFADPALSAGEKWQRLIKNWQAYFTSEFLLHGQLQPAQIYGGVSAPNVRHGEGQWGVLTWTQAFLVVLALVSLLARREYRRAYWRETLLALLIIAIGTVPAAITDQIPHSNQALAALPGWILLASLGMIAWRAWWPRRGDYYASFVMLILAISGIEFGAMQKHYLAVFRPEVAISAASQADATPSAQEVRAASYLFATNLVDVFRRVERERRQVEQIIFAADLEHPYIYALVATGMTPEQYRYGKLSEKYLFVTQLSEHEINKDNVIIIYSPPQLETLPRERAQTLTALLAQRCQVSESYFYGDQVNLQWCWTKTSEDAALESVGTD